MDKNKIEVEVGDVVQFSPSTSYPCGFVIVTEIIALGVKGCSLTYYQKGEVWGRCKDPGLYYHIARWEEIVRIGRAEWVPEWKEEKHI